VPWTGTMTVLQLMGVHPRSIDGFGRFCSRVQLALTGSKLKIVVHPDVDAHSPYLFVQNHVNHFDFCTMYSSTPHFKQGIELASHFRYPIYGWLMKSRGTIPVREGAKGQTAEILAHVRREVAQGHSILAFPEGGRTLDGRVNRFRNGIFFIARDAGLPVVPVAVTGMYEVMRKGSLVIRPGHEVTVYVEKPIATDGVADADIPALAERVRSVIAARVDAYIARRTGEPSPAETPTRSRENGHDRSSKMQQGDQA
jgi:1-acyl-sn-glycerol-3-phosphate acyltransferase